GLVMSSWQPERLDVIAFKHPRQTASGKPIIYAGRVVGLPGELTAIHRGKLWMLPFDAVLPDAEPESTEDRFPSDPESERLFKQGRCHLIRKSRELILTLRRLVHDGDHPTRSSPGKAGFGWQPSGGWIADSSGRFRLDKADFSQAPAELVYRHGRRGQDEP